MLDGPAFPHGPSIACKWGLESNLVTTIETIASTIPGDLRIGLPQIMPAFMSSHLPQLKAGNGLPGTVPKPTGGLP